MATNNYYNFTHGGTQYGGAQQYSAAQGAAGTAYPPPANYAAQGGQAAYPPGTDPYVIAGYTRPASGQAQQQGYFNQAQAGYGGSANKPGGAVPLKPGLPSTAYPSYSANSSGAIASGTYAGFAAPQTQPPPGGAKNNFTNYDAAVYNAVTAYAQGGTGVGRGGGGMGGFKKGIKGQKGMRPMVKPQTLHYCDVCKISCAGPQTYKEHLDGQKHKKKEAALNTGKIPVVKGSPAGLRCELCDVTCTGSDAYAAHIRGAKHQKVVKLHTKLGKPIPATSPAVVHTASSAGGGGYNAGPSAYPSAISTPSTYNNFAKPAAPKISFMGTNGNKVAAVAAAPVVSPVSGSEQNSVSSTEQATPMSTTYSTPAAPGGNDNSAESPDFIDKDVQPVGQDYIEEIRSEEGKVVSFNCKLCDCRFNDPNAKEMHMKGRRHRLQYKKKVNPDLIVDVKPSSRQKKIDERRARSMGMRKPGGNDMFPRGPLPLIPPSGRGYGPGYALGQSPYFIPPLMRRQETMDDKYVMTKHTDIYPEEEELQAIQKIVSDTEKALKLVSDRFAEEDARAVKAEGGSGGDEPTEVEMQAARKLKGVMRVGNLAKGLLLRGDREVELVVLCSEKPTVSMLQRVFASLPSQLDIVSEVPEENKYDISVKVEAAAVSVTSKLEPKIEVIVTLTSPVLRNNGTEAPGEAQATQVPESSDLLDKEKCLDALAALRHAKWFQARATTLQSCVIVIRILRELRRNVTELQALRPWAMELLTEKAINSVGGPVSPGEAFRLVFEILSSGILLGFGPGLLDPCEKESSDGLADLSNQAREDITAFAQQSIRRIAFNQIHEVLEMEPQPWISNSGIANRKRRRDPSGNAEADETDPANDLKKDKKEDSIDENDTANEASVKVEPVS